MSQHDDHPSDAPEPPDAPLPSEESEVEAPDPFMELERMFGGLAGPLPPGTPPAGPSDAPTPSEGTPPDPPRIEPARLEMPPLLQDAFAPDTPDGQEATDSPSEPETAAELADEASPPVAAPPFVAPPPAELHWDDAPDTPSQEPVADAAAVEAPAVPAMAETATDAPTTDAPAADPSKGDSPAAEGPPTPGALDELVARLHQQTPPAQDFTLAASAAAPAPVGERCILFELDGTRYALQMGQVIEVADIPPTTPLPHVPAWLLGVSNLRGDILAVLDLRLFLDLGSRPSSSTARMLIVQGAAGLQAGLVVDSVHGVASVDMQALQPPTAPMDDPVLPLLRGVHQQDDRLLAVLDTDKLLTSDALRPFAVAQVSPGTAQPIYAQASSQGPSSAAEGAADLFPSTS